VTFSAWHLRTENAKFLNVFVLEHDENQPFRCTGEPLKAEELEARERQKQQRRNRKVLQACERRMAFAAGACAHEGGVQCADPAAGVRNVERLALGIDPFLPGRALNFSSIAGSRLRDELGYSAKTEPLLSKERDDERDNSLASFESNAQEQELHCDAKTSTENTIPPTPSALTASTSSKTVQCSHSIDKLLGLDHVQPSSCSASHVPDHGSSTSSACLLESAWFDFFQKMSLLRRAQGLNSGPSDLQRLVNALRYRDQCQRFGSLLAKAMNQKLE